MDLIVVPLSVAITALITSRKDKARNLSYSCSQTARDINARWTERRREIEKGQNKKDQYRIQAVTG